MSETRSLLILVVLAIILGAVAVILALAIPPLIEGDLVVDRYQATLQEDGSFQETYTYEVKSSGKYRMLYRYWQDPLSSQPLDSPHIQIIDMEKPRDTVGYLKDWTG